VDWLKDGKAEFPKVEIEVRHEGYRALRAKQNIQRGEWVIFIPRTHFLTLDEVKKACLINRKMIQVNHNPMSHQTYFVNHLL
jgi:protein-histidine N-methyltransferase